MRCVPPSQKDTITSVATTKKARTVFITVLAVGVAGLIIGVLGALGTLTPTAQTVPDLQGNQVHVDPGTLPSAKTQKAMRAVPDIGQRLKVPSVGLDVRLGELSEADNTITPPGFDSAYLVRNLGASLDRPGQGTLYVVAHSVRGGGIGPGNYLIDVEHGTARVKPGATVQVGDHTYVVTGSKTIDKDRLPDDPAMWANTPRRLVLITCLQRPSGAPSSDNLIITATLR
jgi:hypothetical protein